MLALEKILLPVDFSDRCLGAARYAQLLASRYGSEILLLHVVEPIRYEFSALEFGGAVLTDLAANRKAQARERLEAFLAAELRGSRVRRLLADGEAAQTIVETARREGANLIAMPTHGYGRFRRFILGSVTAKVLHDAHCPVWTGIHLEQAPVPEAIRLRNVLCAVDLGPHSAEPLRWAAALAHDFQARLLVAHACPRIELRPGECGDRDLNAELAASAQQRLGALLAETGAQADLIVECGDAPRVVCSVAASRQADLMVIGRGSAAGIYGRLRTNAYAIIRESPCPVVSV
ncbi:MAG: universal stress protein [Bryobacterales bacterium]|nr:universal stress protein [Bryobacteraceae bacterium]MDW8132000.1 universal stress protein [Bryobacterales bacterium]